MPKKNARQASSKKVPKQNNYELEYSEFADWHDEFDESLLDTNESIEDLGFPTVQPASDDATPICDQRILWSNTGYGRSGRSLEIRSLWHWTHGHLIPYGNSMIAACDEPGNRMTFLRLDGSRVTDKWFEIEEASTDPFELLLQDCPPRFFSCERIFLKRKGEDVYRLFNTNLEEVSQNTYVETAVYFEGNTAWAKKTDGTVVLVHKDGSETPIEKTYARYGCFHGNAAPVSSSTPKTLSGSGLSNNVAVRGCWGLINNQGKEIVSPQFAYINAVADNLFIAVKDAKQSLPKGRLISKAAEFYLYNDKGQQLLPDAYEGLVAVSNRASPDGCFVDGARFWAKKDGSWGLINQNGDELIGFILGARPNSTMATAWNDLTVVKLISNPKGKASKDLDDIVDVETADSVLQDSVGRPHIDSVFNDQNIVVKDLDDGSETRFVYSKEKIKEAHKLLRANVDKQYVLTDSELSFLNQISDRCLGYQYNGDLSDLIDKWSSKPLKTTTASDGWHLIELNVKP